MPTPERILLIRLSHLGDVVHALPVFHALREAHPAAEIAWVVQREFADLLTGLEGLSRTFFFGRRDGFRAWPRLRSDFLDWAPNWSVDAQGNLKSAFVALSSGAARRSGPAHRDWTEGFGANVLTDSASPADGLHAMDRTLALARHVAPGHDPRFDLALTAGERDRGAALARERAPGGNGPLLILHLGGNDDVRSWPAGHFAQLAQRLAREGGRVLILSGPAEAELGAQLTADLSSEEDIAHWVGQQGLRDLAAFFTIAGEAGARLVACDSGPAHVAAACGLPVTLLAGPQDPRRTGPWPVPSRGPGLGTQNRVVTAAEPPPCMPCRARTCAHPAGTVCMTGIDPEDVARALLDETARAM